MDPIVPLAADSRSLDGLRAKAARDPASAVRQAASQFEALFMRQVLKSMRDAMPRSGMWDGPSQSTYEDMLDQQLAQVVSGRRGGLADVIARQLSGNVQGGLSGNVQGGPAPHPVPASVPAPAASVSIRAPARQRPVSHTPPLDSPGTVQRTTLGASKMPDLGRLDATQTGFVRRMWPNALLAEQTTGVPAAWIVGQAALESGWGRKEIRNADGTTSHNLFGIKAGASWSGAATETTTTEYVDGRARRQVERFRSYDSYAESFIDWARLMTQSARYGDVLRSAEDVRAFSSGMQKAGYATDPQYGSKLERIINQTLTLKRLVL